MSRVIGGTWAFAALVLVYFYMDAARNFSLFWKSMTLAGVVIVIIIVALILLGADPEE